MARVQAESFTNGLQLVLQEKAINAGDFLMSQMPKLVSFKSDQWGQKVPQGLFAPVSFPTSNIESDILGAMANVGLNVALNAISAIPIIGRFAGLFVNLATMVLDLLGKKEESPQLPPLLVPWANYTRESDNDLVNLYLIKVFGGSFDWTNIYRPALRGTWSYELAAEDGQEKPGARVFAPLKKGGEPAWTGEGLGAIPNTMRMAAPVQTIQDRRLWDTVYGSEQHKQAKADYARRVRYALNASNQYVELEPPPTIIDTGAFKPAFAGIAGQLWQQIGQRGNPDMYKVQPHLVRDEWEDYWGEFFEGGWAALAKAQKAGDREAMWVWAALTPYICLVQQNGKKVVLGMPGINRPHGGVLVTPRIFEPGHGPATIETRTGALYLEAEDADGQLTQVVGQFLNQGGTEALDMAKLDIGPPWTTEVLRDSLLNPPAYLNGRRLRAVPWPTGEELLSYYKPPDVAITTPACNALAKAQRWSLERTLVCAYVRPVPAAPADEAVRPAYAAFDPATPHGKKLRDDCLALRELLLKHPARFQVNLIDVDAVDRAFADRLRKSGVTQAGLGLGLASKAPPPLVDTPDPEPPPLPDPAGGLPFDRPVQVGPDAPSPGGGAWPWVAGGTVIVAGAAAAIYQAQRVPPRRRHAARQR